MKAMPRVTAATGPYGLAEVRRTPRSPQQNITIEARDKKGNLSTKQFTFQGQYSEETVLLRPEKPVYQVGETMKLTLLTSQPAGTVYLDIIREKQIVSTRAVEVQGGQAQLVVDLTPDLYGTLELHAYKILRSGAIVRDTRLVVVDPADDLKVQSDRRPGDLQARRRRPAERERHRQRRQGRPIRPGTGHRRRIGLRPGRAGPRLCQALLHARTATARTQIRPARLQPARPDRTASCPSNDPQLGAAVGKAAQASLAEAVKKPYTFSLQANSHQDNVTKANTLRKSFFQGLTNVAVRGLRAHPAGHDRADRVQPAPPRCARAQPAAGAGRCLAVVALLLAFWPLGERLCLGE